MRRGAVLAAVLAIGAAATPAAAQVPAQDSVTGSALTGIGRESVEFTFDVNSGPAGESPTGTVHVNALVGDLGELEVTCLTVAGNRARMVFRFPAPTQSGLVGGVIAVQDNGTAGPDLLDWEWVSTLPGVCPVPAAVFEPISSGDIVVLDAPAAPISKEQCKTGGWRAFGVFRNQGACVSFVARNP